MENINWVDGQNADGKYILQIHFASGGTGYMKNDSYDKLCNYYTLFWDCPEVVGLTIYNPSHQVIATKTRMSQAA